MIEALSKHRVFEKLCEATKKWGLYISFSDPDEGEEEIFKAAPYLNYTLCDEKDYEKICCYEQIISDGWGIFLFDTEEEMEDYYWKTVGDDGPTKLNQYKGNFGVYALTCDPNGQMLNENT